MAGFVTSYMMKRVMDIVRDDIATVVANKIMEIVERDVYVEVESDCSCCMRLSICNALITESKKSEPVIITAILTTHDTMRFSIIHNQQEIATTECLELSDLFNFMVRDGFINMVTMSVENLLRGDAV